MLRFAHAFILGSNPYSRSMVKPVYFLKGGVRDFNIVTSVVLT